MARMDFATIATRADYCFFFSAPDCWQQKQANTDSSVFADCDPYRNLQMNQWKYVEFPGLAEGCRGAEYPLRIWML